MAAPTSERILADDLRPHDLRHLYAVDLVRTGVPLPDVAKLELVHVDFPLDLQRNVKHFLGSSAISARWRPRPIPGKQVTRPRTQGCGRLHSLLAAMYAGAPYTVISREVPIHPTVSELLPTVLQHLEPLK